MRPVTWRAEALGLALMLLLVVLWDLGGGDLWVARLWADAKGFVARDSFWARQVLHDGARWVTALALVWLSWDAWRPAQPTTGPSKALRRWAWLAFLVAVLVVPAVKQVSLTSCPWSLSEFGGEARWVSHWQWGVGDGGPGHCFPSGHAAGSFAFVGVLWAWLPWRRAHPRVFTLLALAVLGGGVATSVAQWARGAHYVSHSLWAAWLCAVLTWLVVRGGPAWRHWRAGRTQA